MQIASCGMFPLVAFSPNDIFPLVVDCALVANFALMADFELVADFAFMADFELVADFASGA